MLSKLVALFLIGMAVLAMFGKWRVSKRRVERCARCGAIRAGRGPCVCQSKGR